MPGVMGPRVREDDAEYVEREYDAERIEAV
jgi:hypothetical protein